MDALIRECPWPVSLVTCQCVELKAFSGSAEI